MLSFPILRMRHIQPLYCFDNLLPEVDISPVNSWYIIRNCPEEILSNIIKFNDSFALFLCALEVKWERLLLIESISCWQRFSWFSQDLSSFHKKKNYTEELYKHENNKEFSTGRPMSLNFFMNMYLWLLIEGRYFSRFKNS